MAEKTKNVGGNAEETGDNTTQHNDLEGDSPTNQILNVNNNIQLDNGSNNGSENNSENISEADWKADDLNGEFEPNLKSNDDSINMGMT